MQHVNLEASTFLRLSFQLFQKKDLLTIDSFIQLDKIMLLLLHIIIMPKFCPGIDTDGTGAWFIVYGRLTVTS